MSKEKPPIVATRSYQDGCIKISISLKASGFGSACCNITASTDLTVAQARELVADLILYADLAEAKVSAKMAAGERRKKWLDREISAGRMKIFGLRE